MSLELGLRALLLRNLAIRRLIPDQVVQKQTFPSVFNEDPPEGVKPPFILIHQIDFDPMKALDGTSGMTLTEIDIDCYGTDFTKLQTLGTMVADYLKDFTGALPNGHVIDAVLWQNKRYDREIGIDGTDTRRRIFSSSFEIQSH